MKSSSKGVRRHFLEQFAADGKQLAGCSYCGVEAGIEFLESGFVFPVEALATGCGVVFGLYGDALFSCHAAHFGGGKRMHYFAQCFAVEVRVGIGEDNERCGYEVDSPVQRSGFSLPLGLVEYGGLRPVRKAFVGTVVAAVRYPKYMQFVGRIVQSKAVAHFLIYDVFFVVGGDEQRQVGGGSHLPVGVGRLFCENIPSV